MAKGKQVKETARDGLKIEYLPIKDIRRWEGNPKLHNQTAINKSMDKFGIRWPIMVQKSTNRIVAGHGRLDGFESKGMTEVPVLIWDCTDEEAEAFLIADNQTTISGEWDIEGLASILDGMDQEFIDTMGFTGEELDKILESLEGGGGKSLEPEIKPEIEFTAELLEEHNYLVFAFNNSLDWQVIKSKLGIKTVKEWDDKEGYQRRGTGRVIDGKILLEALK